MSGFSSGIPVITRASGAAIANVNPGNTTENILATVSIPAGAMGPNGFIEVVSLWSHTNSANIKTPRVRLGGIAGFAFINPSISTSASSQLYCILRNRNSVASQVAHAPSTTTMFGSTSSAVVTGAIDTSAAQDLVFTAQLALGTETLGLEAYIVRVWNL